MTFLQLRGGLIAVALYFAACALVTDAPPATRKDTTMSVESPALVGEKPTLSRWHPHTEEPRGPTTAIILLQPPGADPVTLSELYRWDADEGYWISASSHLKIRHAAFFWAELVPRFEQRPQPWQRDEEAIADLLGLVGVDVLPVSVVMWTDAQVQQAEDWAAAAHLQAGDHDIEVPPMPEFLSKFDVDRAAS